MGQQPFGDRHPRAGQRDPVRPVAHRGEIVRVRGQVGEDPHTAAQLDPQQTVGAGLHQHQRRLVRGQRDPVGEVQPVGHHLGATAARMVGQHPAVGTVLQQVPLPVRDRKPVGAVGEVDGAVAAHRRVVGQVHRGCRPGQFAYRAVGRDPQQPPVRVADHQGLTGRVQLDAERTATGLGQQLGSGAGRRVDRPPPEPTVLVATDHPPGAVDQHVLGADGARRGGGATRPGRAGGRWGPMPRPAPEGWSPARGRDGSAGAAGAGGSASTYSPPRLPADPRFRARAACRRSGPWLHPEGEVAAPRGMTLGVPGITPRRGESVGGGG